MWAGGAALATGVGLPYLELARACRRPISESCVWGRAYLPLNVAATVLLVGAPVFAIVMWVIGRQSQHRSADSNRGDS